MAYKFGGCIAAALTAAFAADPALAQTSGDQWRATVGAGVLYWPEFKGSDDYEIRPFPYINLSYSIAGMALSLEGSALKLDVASADDISFGPLIFYQPGREDDIKDSVVRKLGQIDGAVEGGVFIEKRWKVGAGQLSVGATGLTDISGVHDCYSVALAAGYQIPLRARLMLSVGGEIKWADEKYMSTYYGVTAAGAAASKLSRYSAQAGLEKTGLTAELAYKVSERWGVAGVVEYGRLLDSAADSPIVTSQGSANQFTGGLAVYYSF
jgi:outer membrane protein